MQSVNLQTQIKTYKIGAFTNVSHNHMCRYAEI